MSEEEYGRWLAGVRERLRAARLALGLSHRKAGELTGVPFQTITRVETGKVKPTSEVLFKLAKGYGVSLNSVLCGDPQSEPPAPPKPRKGKRPPA